MRKAFIILSLLWIMNAVLASIMNTPDVSTDTQSIAIRQTTIGTAQDWALTSDEWQHYAELMRGKNGLWYPHLTPPEVLGLNAQTPQQEQHFAEIVAQQEHDKLLRELKFDQAVHQALLRLYPSEPIIQSFDSSPYNPIQVRPSKSLANIQLGDHVILFVDISKGLDFATLPQLIAEITTRPSITLDIYCVNATDDITIRNWAILNSIPMNLVSSGRITLNHDNGRLQKIASHVSLPYVLLVHQGQSTPISLGGLL